MKQPPRQLRLRRSNVIEFPIGARLRPPRAPHTHTINGRPASWLSLAALIVRASRRVRQGWELGLRPDRVDLVFECACLVALAFALGSVVWGVALIVM